MLKNTVLLVITYVHLSTAGVVRTPKIYNALISSDKNLSPSHAYPIIEPVLRTTALGVAFPPLIVQQPQVVQQQMLDGQPNLMQVTTTNGVDNAPIYSRPQPTPSNVQRHELAYHGTLYPLAYDPYFPPTYTAYGPDGSATTLLSGGQSRPLLPYHQQQQPPPDGYMDLIPMQQYQPATSQQQYQPATSQQQYQPATSQQQYQPATSQQQYQPDASQQQYQPATSQQQYQPTTSQQQYQPATSQQQYQPDASEQQYQPGGSQQQYQQPQLRPQTQQDAAGTVPAYAPLHASYQRPEQAGGTPPAYQQQQQQQPQEERAGGQPSHFPESTSFAGVNFVKNPEIPDVPPPPLPVRGGGDRQRKV